MFKKFKAFEAPHSYNFRDPDTQAPFITATKQELINQVTAYREQNDLPRIEELEKVLENYWCGQVENSGKCVPDAEITRSLMTYIKGGVVLLSNMLYKKFATQEAADARAKQCTTCKYNSFPDKGPFFKWADDLAIQSVGQRKTTLDNEIGICAICTCNLRSKVHYGGTLDKFTPEQTKRLTEVSCWQLALVKD